MKSNIRSNETVIINAIGFCRSDDRQALALQEETIRAYASLHQMTLHSVVSQESGSRITADSMRRIASSTRKSSPRLLLISDLGRLTRKGFDDHHRICEKLAHIGITVKAIGLIFQRRSLLMGQS